MIEMMRRSPIDQTKIIQILNEEDQYFLRCHHRPPRGRESEDVVDNAYSRPAGFSLCHTLKWIGFITK